MSENDTAKRSWVESHLKRELTDFQRKAIELLCQGFNTAPYNISTNWGKVDWNWGGGVRFKIQHRSLATYDFSELTGLVILAHDQCVRVQIDALAPKLMGIAMHQRHKRDGQMHELHPTIEQAIERIRTRRAV